MPLETKLLVVGKPDWLKIRPPTQRFIDLKSIVKSNSLHTVCQEANCPNMSECWSMGTATFMILGDICTRGCRFCAVKKGMPDEIDKAEPTNLARAIMEMKVFDYIVLTSVDRDDLPDQGSIHFSECIKEIKKAIPGIRVEALIPDFQGKVAFLKNVVDANPDVLAHNVETIRRLQDIRDKRANFEQSLSVLKTVKRLKPNILTKTSLMLGLGEKKEEVLEAMHEIKESGIDIITLGQYLKPKNRKLEVAEYITPEKFKYYQEEAYNIGFKYCASGPFVRSSYRAGEWVYNEKNRS